MKNLRYSIVLLAFLLAALIMIPLGTAENITNLTGSEPVMNDNGTVTIDGVTFPLVESKEYPLNTSDANIPLTKEQFIAVNQQYFEFLTDHLGKELAEQMMNAEYDRATNTSSPGAGATPGGEGILSIDPVGDHAIGENFFINGTAIIPAGIDITISIYRGSFNPGIPPQSDPWYDHLPTTVRVKYNNKAGNIWSYAVNTTGSYPDEYIASVKYPLDSNINATAIFNLVPVGENVKSGSGTTNKNVIAINPIGDHAVGDAITITGITNLPPGDELLIEVVSQNLMLGPKGTEDFSGAVGVAKVREGLQGQNIWSFTVNSSDMKPEDYLVVVTSYQYGTCDNTSFSISSGENNNRSSIFPTATPNPANIPTRASLLPAGIIIGSLLCATFLFARRSGR